MKKIIGLVFAALLIVAGFSVNTNAQYRQRRSIDARQTRQQTRIYSGVRSGRLTPAEAYRLQRQQSNIYRTESRYRNSGGRFTYNERRNIQRRLNNSNRSIYNQKHDRQRYRTIYAQPYYPRRRL